jgi:hypothetical protein
MDNMGEIIIISLIVLVLGLGIGTVIKHSQEDAEFCGYLIEQGYCNGDIKAFCKSYDYDPKEIFESNGLRKQFDMWLNGETSGLDDRKSIIAKEKAEQAQSSANVAMAMSVASMSRR